MSEQNENKFQELLNKAATLFDEGSKKAKDVILTEVDKLKIRSEIGQNERDITKEYTKLGEAYYNAKVTNSEVVGEKESLAIISSKKRTVELLKEKIPSSNKEEGKE